MANDYVGRSEEVIDTLKSKLEIYDTIKPFKDKSVSDTLHGWGGKAAKKLHKAHRKDMHTSKLYETDAKVAKDLTNLYNKIEESRNKDPEFYSKAKTFLNPISNLSKKAANMEDNEDRERFSYVVRLVLNKFENTVGIEPKENKGDIVQHLRDNTREEAKRNASLAYDSEFDRIKQVAEQTGKSEQEIIAGLKTYAGSLKTELKGLYDFISTYEQQKKSAKT